MAWPAADLVVGGQDGLEDVVRRVELEGECVVVDLLDPPRLAAHRELGEGVGTSSLSRYRSSYQKTTSSAVKGWPSDQRIPLRRNRVTVLPSSLTFQSRATLGAIRVPVWSQNRNLSTAIRRLPFSPSPGPVKARRQVPP